MFRLNKDFFITKNFRFPNKIFNPIYLKRCYLIYLFLQKKNASSIRTGTFFEQIFSMKFTLAKWKPMKLNFKNSEFSNAESISGDSERAAESWRRSWGRRFRNPHSEYLVWTWPTSAPYVDPSRWWGREMLMRPQNIQRGRAPLSSIRLKNATHSPSRDRTYPAGVGRL